MKTNQLITEAPMGFMKRFANKVTSKVPGSIGHKAQGKLDTGRVANAWKNQYMRFLGQTGQKPTTDTLKLFLKQKGFNDAIIGSVVTESALIERALVRSELDKIFLTLAQRSAGNQPPADQSGDQNPPADQSSDQSGDQNPPADQRNPRPGQNNTSSIEQYIQNWSRAINAAASQQEKVQLAKEVVNFLADRKGQPETERAKAQVIATMRRSGVKPSVNSKVLRAVKNGVRLERKLYALANMVVESLGLTWKRIGYRIVLSESTSTHVVLKQI